jgi:TonB family protein
MSRPLRVWRESYAVKTSAFGSAGLSFAAHAVVILAGVVATRHAPERVREQVAEMMAKFSVPEDRQAAQAPREERITWTTLGVAPGTGPLVDLPTGQSDAGRPAELDLGIPTGADEITVGRLPQLYGPDSVYSIIEVDSTVQRDPFSAAPVYPPNLLERGVQGSAIVRYVVDTTGRADMRTFQAIRSTHAEFTTSVREALPLMRFTPAKIGASVVRQLVEQEFYFKIDPSVAQAGRKETKPATP